jgi:hypothetical protein
MGAVIAIRVAVDGAGAGDGVRRQRHESSTLHGTMQTAQGEGQRGGTAPRGHHGQAGHIQHVRQACVLMRDKLIIIQPSHLLRSHAAPRPGHLRGDHSECPSPQGTRITRAGQAAVALSDPAQRNRLIKPQ